MVQLSELIIRNPQVTSFNELKELVAKTGEEGERFLEFDIKPDYRDTPRKWEIKLEAAFYWGNKE